MPGVMCQMPPGKVNHFGIEASSGVTWVGWEPGREYTKNIVLKNMKTRPTKIKYRTPASRYFTTLYPQPIALSAGNSFVLPITFRPLEKTIYEDRMEFISTEGSFVIPMKAVLPSYAVQTPESVDMGLCAVDDQVQTQIEIRNISDMLTSYQVECDEPFIVQAKEGVIEPCKSAMIPVAFKPKTASVFNVDLKISFGPDHSQTKTIKLHGIGKYPHLSVSSRSSSSDRTWGTMESELKFGSVYIGRTMQKSIEIKNHSAMNAPFHIEHPLVGPTQVEQVFRCGQKAGMIPPFSSIRIPFSFAPLTVGDTSVDYFFLRANGSPAKSTIKCTGACQGPAVFLSQTLVNFHKVDSGEVVTKPIDIVNESEAEVTFQFQIDCAESVFKIDFPTGTLAPNSLKTILLHFAPVHPINYHRRIACLVHNQGVLFLDLLGTCHTEVDKPAILQTHHLRRYMTNVSRGLTLTSPERLNALLAEGKLVVDQSGALALPSQLDGNEHPLPEINPVEDYINDGYHCEVVSHPPHVSFDVHYVDFGRVTDLNSFEHQVVSLTNHTQGKITVVWTGDSKNVFSVSPATVDILPQKSSAFRVAFRPDGHGKFFGSELECFAFYKSMRDYQLTEDRTHCLPWCLTLTATANTFLPDSEHFIPRFSLGPTKMSFSIINANDSAYRTVILTNSGTTPILFDFEKESSGTYAVKPMKGLLAPSSNQIFVLKFKPTDKKKTHKNTLKLGLNEQEKHTQNIMVYGKVEIPEVTLDSDGLLYFKLTCIGMTSQRTYGVKNLSRVPVFFEWVLKNTDSKVVRVEPVSGIIQPNEKQYHKWYFTPTADQKYVIKATLVTHCHPPSNASDAGSKIQKKIPFVLRAIGEGARGELICKEASVECGPLVVGSVSNQRITLANDSNCNLNYKLHVTQNITGPYANEDLYHEGLALELERKEGSLPARTKTEISVILRPVKRVTYQWDIAYSIRTTDGNSEQSSEPRHLTRFTVTGIYPTMSVIDARCSGSAAGLSKKQLWNLFSLDTLNMFLDGDPSSEELTYDVPTKHSLNRKPPIFTRAILDFNFSSAPVASEPCSVQLMFENNGPSVCIWDFLYPTDLQLELEYWAETGEYDTDELHEMKVMENKLFNIEPKKGKLQPGESCAVTFTYRHSIVGTDRLPVLLKLSYGREILLNFIGVTVEVDRPYIHFSSTRYTFSPVPIGETRSPTQIYELYNGGAVPVKFEIDTFPLRALTQENYGHSIFECLNPKGEIPPGHTAAIEWKFSPLEARTYSVDVEIRIECGETAIVTFIGVGFDKRLLGDTMPITDQSNLSEVPSMQSVAPPGQLCVLNRERISFGNMPLFTRGRRAVVMTNMSTENAASFTWHVTSDRDAQYVTVFPISGCLGPGESVMLKVTFAAFGIPAFYDMDLVCEVKNLTEQGNYEREVTKWENERERQIVEFNITEKDPCADQRTCQPEYVVNDCQTSNGQLGSLENGVTVAPDSLELLHYKTLPPIAKKLSCDDKRLNEKLKRRFDEKFWPKPSPPKSFLLHLGLTGRTHDIVEFQQHFPQDFKKFFIDRTFCDLPAVDPSVDELCNDRNLSSRQIHCNKSEADMLALVLSNILRGLVDDSNFHESCQKVMEEPVPYFQQFSQSKPTDKKYPDAVKDLSNSGVQPEPPGLAGETSYAINSTIVEPGEIRSTRDEVLEVPARNMSPFFRSPAGSCGYDFPEMHNRPVQEEIQTVDQTPNSATENAEEKNFLMRQKIKKMPDVCSEIESIVENTLMNIIQEAVHHEFNITARPRLLALPPRPNPSKSENKNLATLK